MRSEKEIFDDLRRVESALSPENLSHDGELPKREVDRRYKKLRKEREALVKELGRDPFYDEIWRNEFH